jgi:hypothetical protein
MTQRLLTQPGETGRLGELLKQNLGNDGAGWTEFRAAVAFVKRSGVRHIAQELGIFASRATIRMSVGVDRRGSSQEGLQILLDSVTGNGGQVWVFRNADPRLEPTFHPKVYLFKKPGRAMAVVGSGNLTGGGLWTNYEAAVVLDLDLSDPGDAAMLREIETALDGWCDEGQGLARRLTSEYLAKLIAAGQAPTEVRASRDEPDDDGDTEEEEGPDPSGGLFGRVRVPGPPGSQRPRRTPGVPPAPIETPAPIQAATARGQILWQKRDLPRTDAQQTPPGTNPVGGVRLTQARFIDASGERINQKTYFRRTLFGHLGWRTIRERPLREETHVPFEVRLLGQSYGVHELAISDKPSGEAGQSNYTSILHWGDLAPVVRSLELTGKTLTIYGPASEGSPYVLEVA